MTADHLAQVGQLRALAGVTRPTDALTAEMLTGARRLESIVAQWQAFPPRARTLDDAANAIEGLRRSIGELRTRIAPGAPEAA
jgi:hypothetical protein